MSTKFIRKAKWLSVRLVPMMTLGLCFISLVSASQDNSQVSRAEFIAMVSHNQPDHPLLPKNHAELSQEDLYVKTARILKVRGFKVLGEKGAKEAMTDQEFVRITYALSGEPPGKNLFEQKQFLKQEGIVKSADIGITTGVEGKILQTHEGEIASSDIKLASPVFMNDHIKTQPESKATFTFDDKSALTLGENASVNIRKHIYDPEKDLRQTVVNVALGTVRFVVTKGKSKGSAFKVVTPTAVAGVRGTEFVVTVHPNGKTSFINIEGSIDTAPKLPNGNLGPQTILTKGKMLGVLKNGVVSDVQNLPPLLVELAAADALPPGLLKQAEAGTLPAGLMKQADKQRGPPANRGRTSITITKVKAEGTARGPFFAKAQDRVNQGGKGSGPGIGGFGIQKGPKGKGGIGTKFSGLVNKNGGPGGVGRPGSGQPGKPDLGPPKIARSGPPGGGAPGGGKP
ncbi:MAG: FecR domain-containing protein [Nitrospina sp.]|nr:FecR domain-containing protein [Nitrospina sp.]MBT3413686.1 FecR domain-containing protein [Nitrospina sp.]MBT3857559.1 FecR domain-containing protein [Nitrospina sp.]MBT4103499.1 FecR domain-containing protein [Nitrospina sp.]MBT4388711.1 FecR domain-containing protein [Nitrospina sp.]